MKRLAVLGGSSPFTIALIDRVREAGSSLPPMQLVLHGRNTEHLEQVAGYAQRRLSGLDWRVERHADCERTLDGADYVLHQIRYGGMAGRGRDEALAGRFGLPVDETLGPAALQRSLALRRPLGKLSERLARICPKAWVLNLTNPLSLATSLMVEGGVSRCIGLCELPRTTAREAAAFLGLRLRSVTWSYTGLNHRGFIVRLEHRGRDCIAEIAREVGRKLGGFEAARIAELEAIPTKYFHLMCGDGDLPPARAEFLQQLRTRIFDELRLHPDRSPPALAQRDLSWYDQAVLPVLKSMTGAHAGEHVVNHVRPDGVSLEAHARISTDGVAILPAPATGRRVTEWLQRYLRHEQALLLAMRRPSRVTVRRALEADPLVPAAAVDGIAAAVWENQRMESAHAENPAR